MQDKQPKLIKLGQNQYQFEDFYGRKSEIYYQAQPYKFGFSHIKKDKNSPIKQRDMLGRVSSLKTISGVFFYRFVQGKMNFQQLPDKYFLDEVFYEGVKLALLDNLAYQIQQKSENGEHIDIRWIKKEKDKVIDMCQAKKERALAEANQTKTEINDILGG